MARFKPRRSPFNRSSTLFGHFAHDRLLTRHSDGQLQNPAGAGASAPSSGSAYTPPSGYGSKTASGAFKFPLANGFPNIKVPSAELTAIQKQAHGTLPNGALPKKLSDASATTFQVIAFNEIFETAFFTSLLQNVTTGVYNPADKDYVIEAITAVQAQEELHALGANAILASAGRTPIQPCEYKFPTSDYESAIATASLFTDVVLGTLQEASTTFGTTGDDEVLGLVASIVAQEGEQDGWYRSVGKKIPSALPFLSASSGVFAFSALNQLFVVPGSCGNLDAIKVPILQPLTVVTPPMAADSDITFSYPVDKSITSPANLRLVYINQQNKPIVQELQNLKLEGNTVTFTSPFPYTENLLNGLTIATVTNGPTSFANISEVAAAAVWGPGLIEVN
ncbi:sexual development protein [Zymoseptoria brevis]|uniref:Sexual development protein n=1 Tax=Zymoseptoria brevis TaxID=1047168 RepID=A0A0F4GFS4_9PEZI|nr:sexual development protein [Zymoseptoria brevis]